MLQLVWRFDRRLVVLVLAVLLLLAVMTLGLRADEEPRLIPSRAVRNEATGLFACGQSDVQGSEIDKAIDDSREANPVAPKSARAYITRGDAWNSKGERDKAAADYTEAIR